MKNSPVKTVKPKVEPSVLVSEWRSLKIWLISWAEDGVICVHMVNEADAAGMNGHIAKPIEIPELMEALTRFLG